MDLANLLSGPKPVPKPALCTPANNTNASYFPRSLKRSPQPPLWPPVEQPKCSLPSISTLLEGADSAHHAAKWQRLSPPSHPDRDPRLAANYELPPTPPLGPHSQSQSQIQSRSPSESGSKPTERTSISSQSSHIAPAPAFSAQPYASPAPSVSSYSSPIDGPSSSLYYQRPPPPPPPRTSAFQPTTSVTAPPMPQPQPQHQSQYQSQHQHQHQSTPASSSSSAMILWKLPPSQQNHDRHICRTCHKPFSRPSMLRVHSHSHTGEKPFRCTHAGCGKAFSVRSNMRRHERGCHYGRPAAAPATLSCLS